MSDKPHIGALHSLARKIIPLRARSRFVRAMDARLGPKGRHHRGAPHCDMTIPEAQALTELAEDLDTGAREWPDWDPDLVYCAAGPSRQEVAAEEAAEAARQAWEQLGMAPVNAE